MKSLRTRKSEVFLYLVLLFFMPVTWSKRIRGVVVLSGGGGGGGGIGHVSSDLPHHQEAGADDEERDDQEIVKPRNLQQEGVKCGNSVALSSERQVGGASGAAKTSGCGTTIIRRDIFNPVLVTRTYRPGEKTVLMEGLYLSTGLAARKIAAKGQRVPFDTGGHSIEVFHTAPDGAAVFEDPATGDYVYASNSESALDGGVGVIRFNAQGHVKGYQRLLFRDPHTGSANKTVTSRNCGVGKTPWDTLITCEEKPDGRVWEVDPWGEEPGRMTRMVAQGRSYESSAFDNRDKYHPIFFITTDELKGPLVKYTPNPTVVAVAVATGDYSNVLHSPGGTYEYFKVTSIAQNAVAGGAAIGTYAWTTDVNQGNDSASVHHKNGEGIDVRDGLLYYTTKEQRYLYIIDLDSNQFSRSTTVSGAFDGQPDQVARVLDFRNGSTDGILYFCEEASDGSGVHGRDAHGNYFTILEDGTGALTGETTGLAFSPNGMFMYVSFQDPGVIFEISRTDGLPFHGATLDIKYHANGGGAADDNNGFRDRMLFA